MLRYGIYTRKSDDDRSVTEKSIKEQLLECQRLTLRDNLDVVRTWEESRSAKTPRRRPMYSEMISMIECGKIDAIACWHINRLVRNMEEGGHLAQLLIDGKLREIRTPAALYRTGDNIMPLVIEAASATQFSLDHARTVTRGMIGSFKAGGCIHAAPQGYRNCRDPLNLKKGRVEPDPERFHMIRRAWDLMMLGTYTVRQVADTLNIGWNYRARPSKKRPEGRPLSQSGLYQLFRNPFYAGYVRRKGELVRGAHEPMVTIDEFERVQQVLKRRGFAAPRKRDYAFTGLMRCAYCGQFITAEVTKLRDGRLWESYHCADSKRQCTKRGLSEEKVRSRIGAELDALRIDPELLAIARDALFEYLNSSGGSFEKALTDKEGALIRAERRILRLDEMWLDGILVDEHRYRTMQSREQAKRDELLRELELARGEASRMKENAKRATVFLMKAEEELKIVEPQRAKIICKALATTYMFAGREKTITISIHPLLEGMVTYARKYGRLEPHRDGSQSKKKPLCQKAVHSGGRKSQRIEPAPSFLEALKGELFPDLWEDQEVDLLVEAPQIVKRSRFDDDVEALLL